MDKPIASAVDEKLSVIETAEFFIERARRADLEAAIRIMNRVRGEPPSAGDDLPRGYSRAGAKGTN